MEPQKQDPDLGGPPPQGGYQPPQGGYQPPQGGYQPPQGGYQPPQGGYQPPQGGNQFPQADPPPQYPGGGFAQAPPGQSYPQGQPYGGYPVTSGYGQPAQTTVVVSQPGTYAAGTNVMAAPPNHMALSILTCLFCFWPLSLVAIIKSNEVDAATRRGDLVAANAASQTARRFSMLSIGFGIGVYILVVVIVIIQVAVVSSTYSRY